MLSIECEKCGNHYTFSSTDRVKMNTKTGEFWFINSPNICDDCKQQEKIDKRDKKLQALLKPTLKDKVKKWIKKICI